MKNLFLIIAFLPMILSSNKSEAQSINVALMQYISPASLEAISRDKTKFERKVLTVNANVSSNFKRSNRILSETKATNVPIKAVRNFVGSFRDISDAKWFTTEGGYVASFLSKGVYSKITYDEKGRWLYNLLEYIEANLIFEIRHMVKSKYYDHDILVIHQYEFNNNKTVYVIRLQDQQSSIITLKVCDGEIEDITNYEEN